ncbi:hypothetical protein [Fibrobacter sp. UBA4297]|uniref:hypothetical protein n=1 Tax=Fibrobacter sp. UBA4297 TaxID=1946536 RepID=UPI0025BC21FE|nr:hypothetical protein [Fibrobacter sp. UBA4297]
MMKILVTILLMFCVSYSKPNLRFDQSAKKFLKERHLISGHRMSFSTTVRKNSRKSFVVDVDTTSKMQSLIMLSLKGKCSVLKNDDNSLRIKNDKFRIAMDKMKKNESKFSELVLKKLLPDFIAKQFDFISLDVEQQFDLYSDKAEEIGYIFNYQRVYNNRIVRSAYDYLTIALDSDGKLKWAEIMMSDLKTTLEYVETEESVDENENALGEVVSTTIDSLENRQTHERRNVKSVVANSAAEAYCEVEDGGKIKLHPCISYTATMELDNGESVFTIIDAPHSLKSWRNYKNGKKKHIHYANGGVSGSVFVLRK